jgi:hypothetical protein
VVDLTALRLLLTALAGRWNDQWQEALAYLIEENRILRAQLRGRRLGLTDEDRRRLARRGHRLVGKRCGDLMARSTRVISASGFGGRPPAGAGTRSRDACLSASG